MLSDEDIVRGAVSGHHAPSHSDEIGYASEMGENYAPVDEQQPVMGENDIGFNYYMYPTLHRMALSPARLKFCVGPAGCLAGDTEVLTREGWVKISEAPQEIMVYDPATSEGRFERAEHVKLPCPEGFHRFYTSHAMDMAVSDEHKVWYKTRYAMSRGGDWQIATGAELAEQYKNGTKRTAKIPAVFEYKADSEYPLTDAELRVQIMLSADGHLPKSGSKAAVTVRKPRKVERIRQLLNEAGIEFTETIYPTRPTEVLFKFVPPEWNKDLSKYYGASQRQLALMAHESLLWDGNIGEKGSYYCSNNKKNVDFIQFAFVSCGIPSIVTVEKARKENWNDTYRATVGVGGRGSWVDMRTAEYEHIPSEDGYKYCYTTSTGMFVARRNGKVFCTGNSAKTSGIIWTLLLQAIMQEPAADGVRYSRALVARNTNSMLRSTTIPSFKTMVGNLMTFRTGSFPMMAHARFELNDGTKVHFDVEFLSFDDEKSQNKLLGCEPTFGFIDELSEFPESLVFAIDRRLGRYPSGRFGKATWVGLFGATNGPLKNHWLYRWYLGDKDDEFKMMSERMGRPYFELFRQPPALLRQPDGSWDPNPMAENIENLPGGYNYYYAMLGGEEQKIKAYVEGEFADLVTGKVVFPEFNESRHVIDQFNVPAGAPLYLSFDFGRTPVCLVGTMTAGGRLIIVDEVMGEDMSIETLTVEHIKPTLRRRYINNLVEGAWGDPAGLVQAQSVDVSPYDILLNNGIPIESPGTNKLQPRIEAVKQRLTKLDSMGQPLLQITKNCKFLIEALKYNYIYENVRGKNDVVRDTPTKSHEGWTSDLADALQYMVLGINISSRMSKSSSSRSSRRHSRFI